MKTENEHFLVWFFLSLETLLPAPSERTRSTLRGTLIGDSLPNGVAPLAGIRHSSFDAGCRAGGAYYLATRPSVLVGVDRGSCPSHESRYIVSLGCAHTHTLLNFNLCSSIGSQSQSSDIHLSNFVCTKQREEGFGC